MTVLALDRIVQGIIFPREHFMKTPGFHNPLPSLFLHFSLLFSSIQTHLSVSNAISLDFDIINKYTRAKKKKSPCEVPTFLTSSLLCPSPSPPPMPAIIQLSGRKGMVFYHHHLISSFLTSPSLYSMSDYYNQLAFNSFVPLSLFLI